jgi:hypothetical protein
VQSIQHRLDSSVKDLVPQACDETCFQAWVYLGFKTDLFSRKLLQTFGQLIALAVRQCLRGANGRRQNTPLLIHQVCKRCQDLIERPFPAFLTQKKQKIQGNFVDFTFQKTLENGLLLSRQRKGIIDEASERFGRTEKFSNPLGILRNPIQCAAIFCGPGKRPGVSFDNSAQIKLPFLIFRAGSSLYLRLVVLVRVFRQPGDQIIHDLAPSTFVKLVVQDISRGQDSQICHLIPQLQDSLITFLLDRASCLLQQLTCFAFCTFPNFLGNTLSKLTTLGYSLARFRLCLLECFAIQLILLSPPLQARH